MRWVIVPLMFFVVACVRQETFVLSAGTTYGWVVVEQRSSCPPSSSKPGGVTHLIPPDRYLCTSSAPSEDLVHRTYLMVGREGQRTAIPGEYIHRHVTLSTSGAVDGMPCAYSAEAFYFGPLSTLTGDPLEVLWAHRPECAPK